MEEMTLHSWSHASWQLSVWCKGLVAKGTEVSKVDQKHSDNSVTQFCFHTTPYPS